MPRFKTHKRIGIIAALVFSIVFIGVFYNKLPIKGWKIILIPFVIAIYSQIPDLDSYTSRIRKRALQSIFWIMILSSVISIFINIYLMLILLGITGFLGLYLFKLPHRGPLHSYWFALVTSFPLLFVHWFLALLAFVCSSSHILIDTIYSGAKRQIKKKLGIKGNTYITIKV